MVMKVIVRNFKKIKVKELFNFPTVLLHTYKLNKLNIENTHIANSNNNITTNDADFTFILLRAL